MESKKRIIFVAVIFLTVAFAGVFLLSLGCLGIR